MVTLERDKGLIVDSNADYGKISQSLRMCLVEPTREFLNLQLHPSTLDLSGFSTLVYGNDSDNTGEC